MPLRLGPMALDGLLIGYAMTDVSIVIILDTLLLLIVLVVVMDRWKD